MFKKLISLVVALVLCTTLALAEGVTVTDMLDREITLSGPADRIVALSAADCEILCALGCEDLLVGRGTYCDYPESILSLPVVESGAATNIEQIIALEPQVVLMADMAQTSEQVEALQNAGIQVVISNADTLEEVYTSIRMIGQVVGKNAEAETVIADMQSTFAEIAAKSQDEGKTIYFEVSPLQWGLWAAGSGTFMNELATVCGLTNAFADVADWGEVSEEQVLLRDPEYIVTVAMYFGEGPTPVEEIKSRTGWDSLKAIVNDQIYNADSNAISRPGPRLKDAALALYAFVNGDQP